MEIKYSVKDKLNLAPHELWTCGDYGSINFIHGIVGSYELSLNGCTNGEHSIKFIQGTPANWGYAAYKVNGLTTQPNEKYLIKFDVYNPDGINYAKIYDITINTTVGVNITIPQSNSIQTITFTVTMKNIDGFIGIQFFNNNDGISICMDNVQITKIQ